MQRDAVSELEAASLLMLALALFQGINHVTLKCVKILALAGFRSRMNAFIYKKAGRAHMEEFHKRLEQTDRYPLFVSLDRRICLVVGGGSVAERKIRSLLSYGAIVRVVALKLNAWLESELKSHRIHFLGPEFREDYLDDIDLVFAATDDRELNSCIAKAARIRNKWCNMATDPELGSFIVPSVLQRGPLTIAVSTGGASPALAKRIREEMEKLFGQEWIIFLNLMGVLRRIIQEKGLESSENQRLFRNIAALPVPEWIAQERHEHLLDAIHLICQPLINRNELNRVWDEVWK